MIIVLKNIKSKIICNEVWLVLIENNIYKVKKKIFL